jgi:hypothetical protein
VPRACIRFSACFIVKLVHCNTAFLPCQELFSAEESGPLKTANADTEAIQHSVLRFHVVVYLVRGRGRQRTVQRPENLDHNYETTHTASF